MSIHDATGLLGRIASQVRPFLTHGDLPGYIPQLARVSKGQFGIAFAPLEGPEAVAGEADVAFSIQSISKVFALMLAIERSGDEVWARVGREPSGAAFNELIQVDQESGRVRNPFVNAGALVVTDILCSRYAQPELALLQSLQVVCGDIPISVDEAVARSERETCHRNAAIAHLLKSHGRLQNPVDIVLDTYCWQCALAMSCRAVARAARPLASTLPTQGNMLTPSQRHSINALMLTCGTYNEAGSFAASIGLPLKSGVGGGMVAVIPGIGALCAWSPGLDASGNSIAAARAMEIFAQQTGFSVLGPAPNEPVVA